MNNSPKAHTVEETSPERVCEMITDVIPDVESPSQTDVEFAEWVSCDALTPASMYESGHEKPPIVRKDWDSEYCINECVVKSCRDVFAAWVASRNSNTDVCEGILAVLPAREDLAAGNMSQSLILKHKLGFQ